MSVLQRSLLSLVQAEVAWIPAQEQPSALMNVVAEYLAGPGGHGLWPVRALPALATALRRWGHYSPAMSKVARRLLRVLQLRLSRPCRKGLSPALLLECFCAALPLAPESREPIHRILHYLLPRASDLRPGQLVALVEQCAVAWEGSTEEDRKALQASFRRYRRLRDIPLKVLPRALAALLQMASKETIQSEFWPLLRRSTGRLAYKLREVLEGGDTDGFDVDALGEVFYVCAASGYSDDAFLEASEAWLLRSKAELKVPLTLVHLLHSAAVLHVAKGPLLHLLVAASVEQMANFGAFEVLGFLDAASLLQRQADQAPPMVMEFQKEGPPPSGVGEQGLQASLERLGVLMPTLDDDDLQHFLALLTAMRLPEGLANPIYQEAADRGLLESKRVYQPNGWHSPDRLPLHGAEIQYGKMLSSRILRQVCHFSGRLVHRPVVPWRWARFVRTHARQGGRLSEQSLGEEKAPQCFSDLSNLSEKTQTSLQEVFGYTEMSEVQKEVIPSALSKNQDLVVRAHTGTGKTLAFLIPAIEKLLATPTHGPDATRDSRHLQPDLMEAGTQTPSPELCAQEVSKAESYPDTFVRTSDRDCSPEVMQTKLCNKGHFLIATRNATCDNASTESGCLRKNNTQAVNGYRCEECNYKASSEGTAPEEKYCRYRVSFMDGTEMYLELPKHATTDSVYSAIAIRRAVATYQLKVIVSDQTSPLPCSPFVTFSDVATGDIYVVVTSGIALGWGNDCCDVELVDTSFEHFSLSSYGLAGASRKCVKEEIKGKQLTVRRPCDGRGIFSHFPRGMVFNKWTEEEAAPSVSGRVLLRILIHRRRWAMGIGFGSKDAAARGDPEYDQCFFGLYHGGSSINCCANGRRYHRCTRGEWSSEYLAILIDSDAKTMQCFCGLEPFGELFTELGNEALWPMVVCMACYDCVSISLASVAVLVVSPTRELALQIHREAEMLLSTHEISSMSMIGGTSTRHDQVSVRRKKPKVLVATPGRLLEHLERTYLFPTLFENLQTFVLDEADRLLSLGFLPEVKEIVSYLPSRRRTMLFSATMPETVMDVISKACRGNYRYIDCIGEESSTALMAQQFYLVLPGHQCLAALYNLIINEMATDRYGYKILVFFATARMTSFMAQFFREQLRIGVYEIHRRREVDGIINPSMMDKWPVDFPQGKTVSTFERVKVMALAEAVMTLQFWTPLAPEAQVGVFVVQVLMIFYLSLSFLNKNAIMKMASDLRAWLLPNANEQSPGNIKRGLILQIRKAIAPYVLAFVLWTISLFVAVFVYTGWMPTTKDNYFEKTAVAAALILFCQTIGAFLLCSLRWKKATRFSLDLGYLAMMASLSMSCLPGVCPGHFLTVVVCLVWLIRLALLPLANSILWVIMANLGCSICIRLRLQRRALIHPGDLGIVAEQLLTVDLAVLMLCCFTWLCGQVAMSYNADQEMEAEEVKAESNACESLLATICDAYFFLNKQLNFEQHERTLSSILVQSSNTKDRSFVQFLASSQDQDRFVRTAERASFNHSPLAEVMHVGMRDGLGNVIPVQVFHIALFDIKGEPRHLVGLREYGDQVPVWLNDGSTTSPEVDKAEKYHEKDKAVTHTRSHDSMSSASIDLDNNQECIIIFEPIDMEVMSASRFLMDCLGQLTREGLSIIDLVYASDRNKFRSDLINNVNEFMSSGSKETSFELTFRMKMRWGLTDTTWRCLLSNQDMLLIKSELIRIKKVRNSTRSRSLRNIELGLVEELRPTVYGFDSL
eukprot:symbB.v1.2.016507.t1/scaffold1211.1/size131413/5